MAEQHLGSDCVLKGGGVFLKNPAWTGVTPICKWDLDGYGEMRLDVPAMEAKIRQKCSSSQVHQWFVQAVEGLLSQLGPGFTSHQGQENRGVLSWSCGLHVAWLKVLPGWCILVEASYFRSGMKLRSSIAGRGHQSSLTADESEKAKDNYRRLASDSSLVIFGIPWTNGSIAEAFFWWSPGGMELPPRPWIRWFLRAMLVAPKQCGPVVILGWEEAAG